MITYPEAFERLWAEYPQRPNNPKKPAFKQYQRRILEGVPVLTLLGAVMNYAGQMRYAGKIGTEYVMQAQTFLGPNERWVEFVPKMEKPKSAITSQALKYEGKWRKQLAESEERIDGRPFIRNIIEKLANKVGSRV